MSATIRRFGDAVALTTAMHHGDQEAAALIVNSLDAHERMLMGLCLAWMLERVATELERCGGESFDSLMQRVGIEAAS